MTGMSEVKFTASAARPMKPKLAVGLGARSGAKDLARMSALAVSWIGAV